ncbi:PilT/PilU family type 4a pilus ATPase [Crenobacter cavernae]|uniref:PilT/PilU family type 4a pilus ATPase n=1 Tax=Crenobacter cavernae TaxID=2290923 RepID=A0ABY0FA59_9NEIS|nr:PilT/PilU family type 4a pilus ATPase [Crenobacter cavernae]RXZ42536.1 PilT/PilU family type 4a pilus ATPase [Crenobacter cavernae]
MLMLPFFKLMAEKQASDLFFTRDAPVQIKIDGQVLPVNEKPLSAELVERLALSLMSEEETARFEAEWEMNFGRPVDGLGNFRVNIFRQKGAVAMVVRFITPTIPSLDKLKLPANLKPLIQGKRGLIIVVGATGSGKSSTVAALIGHRNQAQSGHILTVEDPIEFIFEHGRSIVNQREIGVDTQSYGHALKNAMREAPDLLMIGEVRDAETLNYAINYAQSGHLCVTTLHANNSYHMLNRMISFFPPETRQSLLMDLSVSLRAVISQRLVPTANGKLTPAVELLINTPHIAELIRTGEVDRIKEAIENSLSEGSQTFEQSLYRLYQDGAITLDDALKNADSPTNLYWLINNAADSQPARELDTARQADGEQATARPPASFDGFTLDI